MLKIVDWGMLSRTQRDGVFEPPAEANFAQVAAVEIVEGIRRGGDSALHDYAMRFDGVTLDEFRVSAGEIDTARAELAAEDETAIRAAGDAVRRFHELQGLNAYCVETWPGVAASRRVLPIATAGLYVPAGSAPLVSTLIMLAVPAQIAGVPRIAICVPPGKDGRVNATVLATASLLGLNDIYAIGGAQAIAALAFGLGGMPRADKIFGPGNAYVAAAKTHVSQLPGGPAIDLPAGPSEVMVIADGDARPDFVAADLLAQAEHDPMAKVVLVCDTIEIRDEVFKTVESQLAALSRSDIAAQAMVNSVCVLASQDSWVDVINSAAPEHLILQIADAEKLAGRITNAGAIFIGAWTPESAGDYAAGPNHTLPTGRAARAYGGVTVESFQKTITMLSANREGAKAIAPTVERLAALEGLDGHATAMRLRREATS
jgi:histidinol dehydrogenase